MLLLYNTQSVLHNNGMIGSWTDWDLSDLGRKQADNIGKNLAKILNEKSYVMYSSDLKRASQTAEGITKHTGIKPRFKDYLFFIFLCICDILILNICLI